LTFSHLLTARFYGPLWRIFISRKEFEQRLEGADIVVRGVLGILSEQPRDMQRKKKSKTANLMSYVFRPRQLMLAKSEQGLAPLWLAGKFYGVYLRHPR
jgi:hypothetical protein